MSSKDTYFVDLFLKRREWMILSKGGERGAFQGRNLQA